jgi:hypothetical protein
MFASGLWRCVDSYVGLYTKLAEKQYPSCSLTIETVHSSKTLLSTWKSTQRHNSKQHCHLQRRNNRKSHNQALWKTAEQSWYLFSGEPSFNFFLLIMIMKHWKLIPPPEGFDTTSHETFDCQLHMTTGTHLGLQSPLPGRTLSKYLWALLISVRETAYCDKPEQQRFEHSTKCTETDLCVLFSCSVLYRLTYCVLTVLYWTGRRERRFLSFWTW